MTALFPAIPPIADSTARILAALGAAWAAALLATAVAPASEIRDWTFYFALGPCLGAVVTLSLRRQRPPAWLWAMGLAYPCWVLALQLVALHVEILAAIARKTITGPWISGAVSVVGAIALLAEGWLLWRLARWILRRSHSLSRAWELVIPFAVGYLLLRLNDSDRPLAIFQIKYGSAFLLLPLFVFLADRAVVRPSEIRTPAWGLADLLALAPCLLYCRVPTFAADDQTYHHWSFYLGPIWSVKQGGVLLHDVPSQYGLLSVLFPALLPLGDVESFFVAQCLIYLLHAVLVYAVVRESAWIRPSRWVLGFLAFSLVFWMPGMRLNGLGIFQLPSTGAYRFIWALALALALSGISLPGARRLWLRLALVVAGVFWSGESALYVGCVLATYAAGGIVECRRSFKSFWTRHGVFLALCLAAIGTGALGIHVLWRICYGLTPDWYALIEYGRAYSEGFGSLPLRLSGAVVSLVVLLSLSTGLLASRAARGGELAGACACFGFLLATLSYLIPRSHPGTACTLFALWLPVWLRTVDLCWDGENEGVFRVAIVCSLLMVCLTYGKFSRAVEATSLVLQPHVSGSLRTSLAGTERAARGSGLVLPPDLASGKVPILDAAYTLPAMHLTGTGHLPIRGAQPVEQLTVLEPTRVATYLARFVARASPPALAVLTHAGKETDVVAAVERALGSGYRRTDLPAPGAGYALMRYDRGPDGP